MIKHFIVLSFFVIILFSITGCYDARGLETLSYAVAIGIDKGNDNLLRLSLQFAAPSSGSNNSSTQQFTDTTVTTVECSTINSGINLINSYISKQVNLSHAKIIVISESLAIEGISEYISSLINNIEVRPDCNIIISRCNAEDFLNNSKPRLETLSARYYEHVLNSSKYTGYTTTTTLSDFYISLNGSTSHPVAILGDINPSSPHTSTDNVPYVDLDSSYKAGETPIKNSTNLENMGLAVFHGDKLVGELNAIESLFHLICTNEFDSSVISVPSPFNQNGIIDLSLHENGKTNVDVSILNGSPYINIHVSLLAYVLSMEDNLDLTNEKNISALEDNAISYIKENLLDYLYRTSNEFHSDIADFGKYELMDYLTIEDWEKLDWLSLYANSTFHVEVSFEIKSPYLLIKN